jgi:beta-aspartyl-peptidase (threonine type)
MFDVYVGAFSGTGTGEEFIRHVATHDCHCRMVYGKQSLAEAVHATVFTCLPEDCGGIIAVNPQGEFTMPFNTPGMFRAVFSRVGTSNNSNVVKEVGIWEEMTSIV